VWRSSYDHFELSIDVDGGANVQRDPKLSLQKEFEKTKIDPVSRANTWSEL